MANPAKLPRIVSLIIDEEVVARSGGMAGSGEWKWSATPNKFLKITKIFPKMRIVNFSKSPSEMPKFHNPKIFAKSRTKLSRQQPSTELDRLSRQETASLNLRAEADTPGEEVYNARQTVYTTKDAW